MSNTTRTPEAPPEQFEDPPHPKPGMLADPVVRIMAYVAAGLVILVLATVLGVLVTGVSTPTGPRSASERDLLLAASQAQGGKGETLAPYIEALVAAGNLPAARIALEQARASASTTAAAPGLDLAEARLYSKSGQYVNAVSMADKAMKGYVAKKAAMLAQGGAVADRAKATPGYDQRYYDASLVEAYALVALSSWKDAIGAFDIYLAVDPSAADILVDRGNAKLAINDKAGAEKDFRTALKFVPYDEQAKAGLKKIGVAQ